MLTSSTQPCGVSSLLRRRTFGPGVRACGNAFRASTPRGLPGRQGAGEVRFLQQISLFVTETSTNPGSKPPTCACPGRHLDDPARPLASHLSLQLDPLLRGERGCSSIRTCLTPRKVAGTRKGLEGRPESTAEGRIKQRLVVAPGLSRQRLPRLAFLPVALRWAGRGVLGAHPLPTHGTHQPCSTTTRRAARTHAAPGEVLPRSQCLEPQVLAGGATTQAEPRALLPTDSEHRTSLGVSDCSACAGKKEMSCH